MSTETTTDVATRGVLAFPLGTIWLGALVEDVVGLLDAERLAPLPNAVEGLAGLVAFRGDMIPVLDLPAFLGGEPARNGGPRYAIVLGRGGDRFGLLIPELPRLLGARELKTAELSTSDPELGALISSVHQAAERSVHCLNYRHILDSIVPPPVAAAGSRAQG